MSSSKDSVTMPVGTTSEERLIGRVKWFNNKAGYGFVTVTDGSQSGSDIFSHHSAIGVSSQQYKYLVQGEYVEFSITSTQGAAHPFQASNICGIKGGKLMCETRNEFKLARNSYKTSGEPQSQPVLETVKMPRQQNVPNTQAKESDQKDWTLIKGTKAPSVQDSKGHTDTGRGNTGGRGSASGRGRGRPRTTQPTK